MKKLNNDSISMGQAIIETVPLLPYVESQNVAGFHYVNGGREARSCSFADNRIGDNPTGVIYGERTWTDWTRPEIHGFKPSGKVKQYGNVIDFEALYNCNGDYSQAYRNLIDQYPELKKVNAQFADPSIDDEELEKLHRKIEFFSKQIFKPEGEHALNYLKDRGFTEETIKNNYIGYESYTDSITIPFLNQCKMPIYLVKRTLKHYITPDDKSKEVSKYKNNTKEQWGLDYKPLWGLHTINRGKDTLYIAEGFLDAVVFDQLNYSVLSAGTCNFSSYQREELLKHLKRFEQLIIVLDNDKAGLANVQKLVEFLLKHRINNIYVVTIPKEKDQKKIDLNDYFTQNLDSDPKLIKLFELKIDALSFLSEYALSDSVEKDYDYNSYIEHLINDVKCWYDKRKLTKLLNQLKRYSEDQDINHIDPEDYEVFKEIAKSKLTQKEVKDKILSEHDLLFNKAQGIHEFTGVNWKAIYDEKVGAYADYIMGRDQSGNAGEQIVKLVKRATVSDQVFNQSDLMVFSNGTHDLKNDIFRPARRNDFMSFETPDYEYDKNAKCPYWLDRVSEWFEGNKELIDHFQEVCGHILVSDNHKTEVAVYFIGGGSNGKSVAIDTIRKVYGVPNCTSVDPDDLTDGFSRSMLKNALVNVVAEVDPYLGKSSKFVKAIASGDPLNGGKKFKDIEVFNPRCKLIVSANEMPQTSDKTHGFERKIDFVPFNAQFESDSENVNRKFLKKDPELPEKISKELPGIYNWFYEGYKRYVKNGYEFTRDKASQELKNEFKYDNNPILEFYEVNYGKDCKDSIMGQITVGKILYYSELYLQFENYFGSTRGYSPEGFSKGFRKLFLKDNPNWKVDRDSHGRGFKRLK